MTSTPAVPRDRQTLIDSRFLKTLVGYNTRRATLHILGVFEQHMGALDLKPVEFSILALIGANPGVTHSELCAELNLLAPNLTKLLARLRKRHLPRTKSIGRRQACSRVEPERRRPRRCWPPHRPHRGGARKKPPPA
ncbi:MAG: helix-turn-helix domain-containing protein [Mycobacterium sp.]|nr:helix-turn-helix domain-containing protein [Mycobacterium sp.]